jgi:hypothetical protein
MPKYTKEYLQGLSLEELENLVDEEIPNNKYRFTQLNFKTQKMVPVKGIQGTVIARLLRIPAKKHSKQKERLTETQKEILGERNLTQLRSMASQYKIRGFTNMTMDELVEALRPYLEMSKAERDAYLKKREDLERMRPELLKKIAKTLQDRYPLAKVFYKDRDGAQTLNVTTIGGKPAKFVAGKIIRKQYNDEADYEARLAQDRKQFTKAVVDDIVDIIGSPARSHTGSPSVPDKAPEEAPAPPKKRIIRKGKSLDTYISEIDAMEEEEGKFKPKELFNEITENYTETEVEAIERDLDSRFGNTNKDYYRIGDNAKGNRSPIVKKNGEFATAPTGMNGRNLYIILQELRRKGQRKGVKEI